jgi:hypothetical protein
VIQTYEIKARLNAVIDRWAPGTDIERLARVVVNALVPEIRKLLQEQAREKKRK